MLPVIALVGRPNVGKSTLFNRLTRSRDAIVADFPGLTRDRQYGQGRVGRMPYIVVDTGGFEPVKSEGIVKAMASQAELAIDEANVVIFVCDARSGLTPHDQRIAVRLRQSGRKVILVVNKAEGLSAVAAAEFYELGFGEPWLISAAHGQGVNGGGHRQNEHGLHGKVCRFPFRIPGRSLLEHVHADHRQKPEGNPVIHRLDGRGKQGSQKIAQGGHQRLKASEPRTHDEIVPPLQRLRGQALADRDGEGVHRQPHRNEK